MFPVYLKRDENDPPPEDDIAFIVGRDGLYVQKRTVVYRATVPAKEIPTLASVEVKAEYALPPIPAELVMQMFLFFRAVWEREHSEALVLISWNKTRGTFRLDAPEQHVDSTRCRYELADFRPAEGFTLVGSCHSHGTLSAYHSGTDQNDEANFDGIHITFGRITDKRIDIVASLAVGGSRFGQDADRVLGGTKFVKNTPRPVTPRPEASAPSPCPLPSREGEISISPEREDCPGDTLSLEGRGKGEGDVVLTDAGEVIECEGAGLEAIIERNTEPEPQGPIAERVAQWQQYKKKRGSRRGRRHDKQEAQKRAQQDAQRERQIGFVVSPGSVEVQSGTTGGTVYRHQSYEPEGFVIELPPETDPACATPPLEWSAQVHKIEYVAPTYQSSGAVAGVSYAYHGGEAYYIDGEGTPYAAHPYTATATPSCKRCNGTHEEKKHRERDRDAVERLFEDGDVVGEKVLLDWWWDLSEHVRTAFLDDILGYFKEKEQTPPVVFVEKLRVFFKEQRTSLVDPVTKNFNRTAVARLAYKYAPEPSPEVAPRTAPAADDERTFSVAESLVCCFSQLSDTKIAKMITYLSDEEKDALWRGLESLLGGDAVTKWKSMTWLARAELVRDYMKLHRERFLQMRADGLPIDLGPPAREPETPMTEEERKRILAGVMEAAHQSNGWQAFHDAIGFRLFDLPRRDLWRLWRRALPRAKVRVIDMLVEGRGSYGSVQAMAWQLLRDFLLLCGTVEAVWEAITKPNDDLPVIRATEPLVRAFDPEETPPCGVSVPTQLDSRPAVVIGDKDANKESP